MDSTRLHAWLDAQIESRRPPADLGSGFGQVVQELATAVTALEHRRGSAFGWIVTDPGDDLACHARRAREVLESWRERMAATHGPPGAEAVVKIAARTGATYCLHRSAQVGFAFEPLDDDQVITLGNVVIRVLHTPGHSDESICLLVSDLRRGPEGCDASVFDDERAVRLHTIRQDERGVLEKAARCHRSVLNATRGPLRLD